MNDIQSLRVTLPRAPRVAAPEIHLTLPRIVRHMAPAARCPRLAPTVYRPSVSVTAAARLRCA
jgi:hypothetical protein